MRLQLPRHRLSAQSFSMSTPDTSSNSTPENDDQPPPSLASSFVTLELIDQKKLLSQPQYDELKLLVHRVLALIPNTGNLRVCVVDDQRMSKDHLKFSAVEGTTDVLTFDLAHEFIPESNTGFDTKIIDTDLTVCFDEAQRQSANTPHSTIHELLLYTIHGLLHCLGYSDHEDKEYQRMHNKEDELFRQAGLGPLFFHDSTNTTNGAES